MSQQEIEVILSRHLAECLAMPIFIVDPAGNLIFYNEPAEAILGQNYNETGMMPARRQDVPKQGVIGVASDIVAHALLNHARDGFEFALDRLSRVIDRLQRCSFRRSQSNLEFAFIGIPGGVFLAHGVVERDG